MLTVLDPVSRRGRELCEALARSLPELRRRYFHTTGDAEHLITEVAGEAQLVQPLLDPEELEGGMAVILTAPPSPAIGQRLRAWLATEPATSVIDWSVPPVLDAEVAAIFPGPQGGLPGKRQFQAIAPALTGPVRVLGALAPLGVSAAHLTLLTPAADAGTDAQEELAAQAVARLSGHTPARPRHLPSILAFDAGPLPASRRDHLAAQLARLGLPLTPHLSALAVSTFHGHVATVVFTLEGSPRTSAVEAALRRDPTLHLARPGRLGTLSQAIAAELVQCGELQHLQGLWSMVLTFDGAQLAGPQVVIDLLTSLTAA
ncbi:MAG: hypothetical protein MUF10_05300 [Thermoanaerobaculaceae bacterium]|jgi:hypothetical protein|nr:hypothetical protein [Thermoanaerobaculaceae bacterium]